MQICLCVYSTLPLCILDISKNVFRLVSSSHRKSHAFSRLLFNRCAFFLSFFLVLIRIALNRIRCGYYNFITVVVPQSNMENNSWCVYNVGWCTSIYLINIHVQTMPKDREKKHWTRWKQQKNKNIILMFADSFHETKLTC